MFEALVLVSWANGVPVLACLLLGQRWSRPIDAGRLFFDGRPWLGASKTWRGWLASLATTPWLALAFGVPFGLGLLTALAAMLGDALTSFVKRRLGRGASESAFPLDQFAESLLPSLVLMGTLGLSWPECLGVMAGFILLDLALTPIASRLKQQRARFG